MGLQNWLNSNQGVIEAIGLLLVVPIALFSDKIISLFKKREYKKELMRLLLKEFWFNINFVSQLEVSYENNLKDAGNVHIPSYGPRVSIIEKFLEFNVLNSLGVDERDRVTEIYAQLKDLKHEYYLWRELLTKYVITRNKEIYKTISSIMLSYVDPVMQNMLDLWILLVKDFGTKSNIPQIQKLNDVIFQKIKEGKWIRATYKASAFNRDKYKNINKFDVILCWINDWPESEKKILVIKDIVTIHESWNVT